MEKKIEVFGALILSYDAVFQIDLEKDTYTEIVCKDEIRHYYDNSNCSAEATLKKLCHRIVAPEHYERMRRFFDLQTLAYRLRKREYIETECITNVGNWHRARLIVQKRDEAGKVTNVLYTTLIIDAEKEYTERLLSKAKKADLANQAKTEFISQVAHDIRTPMNSIFGFLEIAEANIENPEKVRYSLEKIRIAGEFLKELVDDVLDISRMEKGMMKLLPKEMNFAEELEAFAESIKNAKFEKKQNFHYEIRQVLYNYIKIDSLRLKQIYSNLLSNAVKYTPDGGNVDFIVYQEEAEQESKVCITAIIKDNGIGMSEEFMMRMFNKFERATDTRVNAVSGYGLGLSIVKQLVDLMDGRMEIESIPGQGTTVCIKIDVPYIEHSFSGEEEKKDYAAECVGMHLLVAEDNELNVEVITEVLSMYGITCDAVRDGLLCVEKMKQTEVRRYDAILMDMQMPNMNGIEATKAIRALPSAYAKQIPIIAMTANALKEDVRKCLEAGMEQHLSKPLNIHSLLKALTETKQKV